jgi:hypothetical protein
MILEVEEKCIYDVHIVQFPTLKPSHKTKRHELTTQYILLNTSTPWRYENSFSSQKQWSQSHFLSETKTTKHGFYCFMKKPRPYQKGPKNQAPKVNSICKLLPLFHMSFLSVAKTTIAKVLTLQELSFVSIFQSFHILLSFIVTNVHPII